MSTMNKGYCIGKRSALMAFICGFSIFVYASENLKDFIKTVPITGLPISVGKSSYDRVFVQSSKYVKFGDIAEHEEYFDAIRQLSETIVDSPHKHILSIGSDEWKQSREEMMLDIRWSLSRLPCPGNGVQCVLLGGDGGTNIVVFKNGVVTDFQLASAYRYEELSDGRYGLRISSLDTTFGDGVIFQPLPITDFERTGIFCSSILFGQTTSVHFKRRITPEGKIENKQIEGGYTQCKAPW